MCQAWCSGRQDFRMRGCDMGSRGTEEVLDGAVFSLSLSVCVSLCLVSPMKVKACRRQHQRPGTPGCNLFCRPPVTRQIAPFICSWAAAWRGIFHPKLRMDLLAGRNVTGLNALICHMPTIFAHITHCRHTYTHNFASQTEKRRRSSAILKIQMKARGYGDPEWLKSKCVFYHKSSWIQIQMIQNHVPPGNKSKEGIIGPGVWVENMKFLSPVNQPVTVTILSFLSIRSYTDLNVC